MITKISCDGCGKTLDTTSGSTLDLCKACSESHKTLSEKLQHYLDSFFIRYKTIKTVNIMNTLFTVMEKRLDTPPPVPKSET